MKSSTLNKSWHLAESELEIQFTEFELLLWRVFHSFLRWQEDCENYVNKQELTGQELAILHIVRMQNRPKSVYDICRLLNRDDVSNIKYSIRKLLKIGLIKQVDIVHKAAAYAVTEAGIRDTDSYSSARRAILIDLLTKEAGLSLAEAASTLTKVKTLYEESGRIAASFKPSENNK